MADKNKKEFQYFTMIQRQVLVLTLVTFLFAAPNLWKTGTNIVTNTYSMGATYLLKGDSPYGGPVKGTDTFKYSPLFGILYAPIAQLDSKAEALIWAALNCLFFWIGISVWFVFTKGMSWWGWFALVACAMELNGPLLYQQVNALIVGLILWGLAQYRDRKLASAGFLLSIATMIKVIPGLFLAPLLMERKTSYITSVVLTVILAVGIPCIVLGLVKGIDFHMEWANLLLADGKSTGLMDIATVMGRWNLYNLGNFIRYSVLITSLIVLCGASINKIDCTWAVLISLGLACILLFSPRTEAPTFILIAPSYLFLTQAALSDTVFWRRLFLLILWICIFFITISFNDIWPKQLWNPNVDTNVGKTLGTFGIWLLAFSILCRQTYVVLSKQKKA